LFTSYLVYMMVNYVGPVPHTIHDPSYMVCWCAAPVLCKFTLDQSLDSQENYKVLCISTNMFSSENSSIWRSEKNSLVSYYKVIHWLLLTCVIVMVLVIVEYIYEFFKVCRFHQILFVVLKNHHNFTSWQNMLKNLGFHF
jgi:hypothetical protein